MYKVVTVISLLIATSTNASTTVEDYAKTNGFTQCLARTKELSEFLVKNNSYGSHDFMAKKHPNENPLNSLIVKGYSDGDSHINLSVTPLKNGKCAWSYTETSIYEQACQVVREKTFSDSKFINTLNETTIALDSGDNLYHYLTPSQSGKYCLVTKRETFIPK